MAEGNDGIVLLDQLPDAVLPGMDLIVGGRPYNNSARSRKRRSELSYTGRGALRPGDDGYYAKRLNALPKIGTGEVPRFWRFWNSQHRRYDDYPEDGLDSRKFPKIQDSILHRYIRKTGRHPNPSVGDTEGISVLVSEYQALLDRTHRKSRSSYQGTVAAWVGFEMFILKCYPDCEWAVILRRMINLDDDVKFDKPVHMEIVRTYMRVNGTSRTTLLTINDGQAEVLGRGVAHQSLLGLISHLSTVQVSLGLKEAAGMGEDNDIMFLVSQSKRNGENYVKRNMNAISYDVIECIPYIVQGKYT